MRIANDYQELSMLGLFESAQRRTMDEREARSYFSKYGEETLAVLKLRANDRSLSSRDRRHWQRVARAARRLQREDDIPDWKTV